MVFRPQITKLTAQQRADCPGKAEYKLERGEANILPADNKINSSTKS